LPAYALILNNHGEPVFYQPIDPVPAILDFKVQPNGQMSFYNPHPQKRVVEVWDETYQIVHTYRPCNGYQIDRHDSYIMADGRALLLAAEYRPVDMSQYVAGGDPNAIVKGCVIQEVDAAGLVLWQWLSLDHIPPTDSVVDLTSHLINYIHCYSLNLDDDGNILLSSRHLHEVTKISRQTGEIIWRLGGKGNDFTFVNDPHEGFFFQHDARRLANGNITVYDNRTDTDPSFFSRGVEYSLDLAKMEATMVWQYINTPVTYAGAMGNMQRLPGGNSLIGWGFSSAPLITEVTPAGEKVFELSTAQPGASYRAFRYPWEGHPSWAPALVARSAGPLKIRLYFSWNGATEIASYRIYGDTHPVPATLLAEVPRDGFETSYLFEASGPGLYYFRVMAVDKEGKPTLYSPSVFMVAGKNPQLFPLMMAGD